MTAIRVVFVVLIVTFAFAPHALTEERVARLRKSVQERLALEIFLPVTSAITPSRIGHSGGQAAPYTQQQSADRPQPSRRSEGVLHGRLAPSYGEGRGLALI